MTEKERAEQLDRIEEKLDRILEFNAIITEVAAPFLTGKGGKWLALVARARGSKP